MIRVDHVLADLSDLGVRAAVVHCHGDVVWLFDRKALRDEPAQTLTDASACVEELANRSFRMRLSPVPSEVAV